MNPLSPSARLLLDRYKASEALPASSKARLWANLMHAVARGDRLRIDLPHTTLSPGRSWVRRAWNQRLGKGVAAAVLALPALALAALATQSEAPPQPTASVAPVVAQRRPISHATPLVIASTGSAALSNEGAVPLPEPVQKQSASKGVRSAPARPSRRETTIDGEMQLLNQAQAANLAGDSRRALALLDDYSQRFPSGRLNDVSTVARLIALCNLGQVSTVRREVERFQARYPQSPFKERVSRICASKELP